MNNPYEKYTSGLDLNEPATLQMIEIVEKELGFKLPGDYLDFMLFSNGCEGEIGESYVVMWPIQEIAELNEAYGVEEFTPGIILFGSNGSEEAFGFDMRTKEVKYIMIPFLFEFEAVIEQGNRIIDFFERLYTGALFNK